MARLTEYTDDDRARAVALFQANGGNAKRTAQLLGVSRSTLRGWIGKIRTERVASTTGVARMPPAELVQDRSLELGNRFEDVAVLALGEGMEEAILKSSAKDRAVVAGIATEKAQLLKGRPTNRNETLSVQLVASVALHDAGDRALTALIGQKRRALSEQWSPGAGGRVEGCGHSHTIRHRTEWFALRHQRHTAAPRYGGTNSQVRTSGSVITRLRPMSRAILGHMRKEPPHGSDSTYKNWACRCERCRKAHAQVGFRQRRKRALKLRRMLVQGLSRWVGSISARAASTSASRRNALAAAGTSASSSRSFWSGCRGENTRCAQQVPRGSAAHRGWARSAVVEPDDVDHGPQRSHGAALPGWVDVPIFGTGAREHDGNVGGADPWRAWSWGPRLPPYRDQLRSVELRQEQRGQEEEVSGMGSGAKKRAAAVSPNVQDARHHSPNLPAVPANPPKAPVKVHKRK